MYIQNLNTHDLDFQLFIQIWFKKVLYGTAHALSLTERAKKGKVKFATLLFKKTN